MGSRDSHHRFSAAELAIRLQDLILGNIALYPFSIMTSVQCIKKYANEVIDGYGSSTHMTVTVT